MRRQGYLLGGGALLAVAAAVAVLLVVLLGDGGEPELTRAEYVARVDAVCREYNRRLAAIPAPVAVGSPQAIAASIDRALPLVEERAAKARAIDPPRAVEREVDAMFALSDRAIAELRSARAQARQNRLAESARALGRFLSAGEEAHRAALAIGLSC